MKYRQHINIIGAALSLELYPERAAGVADLIKKSKPDWENFVRVSSGMYVIPAFFLNMTRHDLLSLLPDDLVSYFDLITEKNRERNLALLAQADELEQIFRANEIDFLFLKGMALLRSGLYKDVAERMLGDIDVLVHGIQIEEAVAVMVNSGYCRSAEYNRYVHGEGHHYPRLINADMLAGVDVHKFLLRKPYENVLKPQGVFEKQMKEGSGEKMYLPSYKDLLIHNVLNVQVHDRAAYFGDLHFRHYYDYLLLTGHVDESESFDDLLQFKGAVRKYRSMIAYLFSRETVKFEISNSFIRRTMFFSNRNSFFANTMRLFLFMGYRMRRNLNIMIRTLWSSETRQEVLYRLKDKTWYRRHAESYRR